MATVFLAKLYARFVEIKSSLKRKKLYRTNQSFNFLGSSFSNRDNISALDVENFYSVQYCTQIIRLLAVFGQFFFYVFSPQATYLRYIKKHILGISVAYYMNHITLFSAYLII